METKKTIRKKPGPLPGVETTRTNVLLEPDLVEWAKGKPGGLSEFVRRLLRDAYEREVREECGTDR